MGDTAETALDGSLEFSTLCGDASPVITDDAGNRLPYGIDAYGLTGRLNENGLPNYTVEYVSGDIVVVPNPAVPQTGDNTGLLLYGGLAALSAAALAGLMARARKRKKR